MRNTKRILECALFLLAFLVASLRMNALEIYFVLLPLLMWERPKGTAAIRAAKQQ